MHIPSIDQDRLEARAAQAGVLGLVFLSGWIGFAYWGGRHEPAFQALTIAAEAIAFVGLSAALRHWRTEGLRAAMGVVITLLAAAWCGFTTWEQLMADSTAKAEASVPWRTAKADADAARAALSKEMGREAPAAAGPLTLAAWNQGHAANLAAYTAARRAADQALKAATPATDWLAIGRGFGVELAKLFGLWAFAAGGRRTGKLADVATLSPSEIGRRLNAQRADRKARSS